MPSVSEWVLIAVIVVALLGIVTFLVLFVVTQRKLTKARREIVRISGDPNRRRRLGVAPLAIRTAWQTADSLLKKGIGATVRNSIEDLAGWAQVERPDLARLTADGDVVIVFSDIEGSTELNEALGDQGWVKLLERHNTLIYRLVDVHGGHVVKNQGDGFMMVFTGSLQAVKFSIDVQRALRNKPDRWDEIRVRIGIHIGTSVRRGDDLFGRNVAMAARVADQAEGGEVLLSEPVRDALGGVADIRLSEPREVELKGFRGTHELYPVVIPT